MAVSFLHAYKSLYAPGTNGRVSSQGGVDMGWAIQEADSLNTIPSNGLFMLAAKPVFCIVITDSKKHNKDVLVQSIELTTGKTTD